MKNLGLLFLLLFSSCSLFKGASLSKDISKDINKICLNASGKGRLIVNGEKYVYSFESALRSEEHKWVMAFNFPLYGEEFVQLEWKPNENTVQHHFSFEDKILKQQKGISPEKLELFFTTWARFLYEVIKIKEGNQENLEFDWSVDKKELRAQKYLKDINLTAKVTFKNLVPENYFGRYDIAFQRENDDAGFKIESIVRKCLEKPE